MKANFLSQVPMDICVADRRHAAAKLLLHDCRDAAANLLSLINCAVEIAVPA
jgi:hypothetical protein